MNIKPDRILILIVLLITSCSREDENIFEQLEQERVIQDNRDFFSLLDISPDRVTKSGDEYIIDGDMRMKEEDIVLWKGEFYSSAFKTSQRKYSIVLLNESSVVSPITIKLAGNIPTDWVNALEQAISEWNLSSSLTNVSFTQTTGATYNIYVDTYYENNTTIAWAYLPHNPTQPGRRIRINTKYNNLGNSWKLEAMVHELGHAIGLLHTNQTDGVHIQGTPNSDANSVMHSYNKSYSGFTDWDILAASSLYPSNYQRLGVRIDNDLYIKEGHTWTKVYSGVSSFDLEGSRIGVLTPTGDLYIKEGAVNAGWVHVSTGVSSFDLEGNRIGVLAPTGELSVKEGSVNAGWLLVSTGVSSFDLEGSRIGVLAPTGELSVKEGSIYAGWTLVSTGVSSFDLEGNRIGVLAQNGELSVKEGPVNAGWVPVSTGVSSFELEGNRIGVLAPTGEFSVKEGSIYAGWTLVSIGASSFDLEENRIGVISQSGEVIVKEGPVNAGWYNENSSFFTILYN